MSCAVGTLVRTGRNTFERVEQLFEGAELFSVSNRGEQEVATVNRPLLRRLVPCVRVKTDRGQEILCERGHTFCGSPDGGVVAGESLDRCVRTAEGSARIVGVEDAGPQVVIELGLTSPGVYEANGFFC